METMMDKTEIHFSSASIERPKVSIIMNCLNCSKYLKEAIDSVYSQTYDDWEIIFWDNASTDNSAEIVKNYDDKLRYFCSDVTVPLGHARNFAIEKARGEYIAFLDCDDAWLPNKMELEMAVFEAYSDVMLVYSNCYIVNSDGNVIKTVFDSPNPRGYIFNELLSNYNFIPLLTAVVNKKVLIESGLFKKEYNTSADYDLFLKVTSKYLADYVDVPLAKYRVHDTNYSMNMDVGIKEELEIMDKWLCNNPELRKEIGYKVKIKKIKKYASLYLYYIIIYLHLPKKLIKFY